MALVRGAEVHEQTSAAGTRGMAQRGSTGELGRVPGVKELGEVKTVEPAVALMFLTVRAAAAPPVPLWSETG